MTYTAASENTTQYPFSVLSTALVRKITSRFRFWTRKSTDL